MASGKESTGLDNLAFDVSTMTYSCKIGLCRTQAFLGFISKCYQQKEKIFILLNSQFCTPPVLFKPTA